MSYFSIDQPACCGKPMKALKKAVRAVSAQTGYVILSTVWTCLGCKRKCARPTSHTKINRQLNGTH